MCRQPSEKDRNNRDSQPPCVSGSLLDSKEGDAIKFKGEGGRHFGEVGVEEIISH